MSLADTEGFKNCSSILSNAELLRFHFDITLDASFFRQQQFTLSVRNKWEALYLKLEEIKEKLLGILGQLISLLLTPSTCEPKGSCFHIRQTSTTPSSFPLVCRIFLECL